MLEKIVQLNEKDQLKELVHGKIEHFFDLLLTDSHRVCIIYEVEHKFCLR